MTTLKTISIKRTARYYLSDEPSSLHKNLCFVLHGYGQLPEYFIKKFAALNRSDILFVAPEGLHRFYLNGSKGRVGASWMTKENRLQDISDYNQMLEQIAMEIGKDRSFEKIAIFGFSQGVATACRWANFTAVKFEALISWAGAFPPDLNFEQALDKLQPKELYILCGDEDEFISEAALQEHLDFLNSKGLSPKLHRFKGQHDLYAKPLETLFDELFPIPPGP
ncbi:MAG: alpha/beta hydrolase [Bacteroidetes bacterium]|nr:alpha/beta hydrolase [Bacteroidota bacterium]